MTLFMAKTPIFIHSAYKAPMKPDVRFHDLLAGVLLGRVARERHQRYRWARRGG